MVNIKRQIVSKDVEKQVTYRGENKCLYVTVHQTGNTSRGANAKTHANLQSNGNSRAASWHYTVDDKEAYQSFEDTAQCWHAGDNRGNGNLNSIGVEICINSDGDYKKSVENGAALVRHLLDKHGLSINRVRQHWDWSKKNCPAQIRANKDGISWDDFIAMVQGAKLVPDSKTAGVTTDKPSKPKSKSIDQLADEVIAGKHGSGDARKKSLGSQYSAVQKRVNEKLGAKPKAKSASKSIDKLVKETLAGKHGNGEARKRSLGKNYQAVQDVINGKSSVKAKSGKSISQMATEVIRGDHGSGHENRRKSLGISKAEYEKVRKEVNKRLK